MILFLGVTAAFITHSSYHDIKEYKFTYRYIALNFAFRAIRSILSLLFGILFLFLPFPRVPKEGLGIMEVFWSFASMVIFMIIPVMVFDILLYELASQRVKGAEKLT
jgi:hypothetical protein